MLTKKSLASLCTLIAALPMTSTAGDQPIQVERAKGAMAKVISRDSNYILQLNDGREATLSLTVNKPIRSHLEMKQIENTCQPQMPLTRCRLMVDVATSELAFRWSKNVPADKLNQILISRGLEKSEVEKLSDENTTFWFEALNEPTVAMTFKSDELVCDSMEWLKETQDAQGNFHIPAWSGEVMIENPETGANENTTQGTLFDVELLPLGPKNAAISKFKSSYAIFPGIAPHITSQVMNFSYLSKNGESCQAAFEVNIDAIQGIISSSEFTKIDTTRTRPAQKMLSSRQAQSLWLRLRDIIYVSDTPMVIE